MVDCFYLATKAWNESETTNDNIAILIEEDFDPIEKRIQFEAKALNVFETKRDDAVN